MKIQYISHHSILEYDEIKLFAELGHSIHSNGAYRDPRGSYTLPRPGIPEIPFDQEFFDLTAIHPKTELPDAMIEPYDALIFMSGQQEAVLLNNWDRIKHKRVIWRTIGQSTRDTERRIKPLRDEGLQIVRYSEMERNLGHFAGEDALIYFYKDPEEFCNWNGNDKRPINFTQSLLGRRYFCHYDEIIETMRPFAGAKVYGTGNDDIGEFNGGEMPYEELKRLLRDSRVYVYGGSWPASYTLSFMEAMMTGIPIVALGKESAQTPRFEQWNFYEVDKIIKSGANGFIADTIGELQDAVRLLLENDALARQIGDNGRKTAIEYFGKEKIKKQWQEFLG